MECWVRTGPGLNGSNACVPWLLLHIIIAHPIKLVRRLLTRAGLESVLATENVPIDVADTYQVYALIWDKFECENCQAEAFYLNQTGKFAEEQWLSAVAQSAKKDGWHVPAWSTRGVMELVAYCGNCRQQSPAKIELPAASVRQGVLSGST